VVATTSGDATLFCNRTAAVRVQWTFRAPGSDQEQIIPGRHRSVKTNYGVNSLVLEDLQLWSAGTYVCRSVVGDVVKPAGAFLVVVAQKPCCHVDDKMNSAQASLTCSVTYAGQMDATLSLLAEGGGVLLSRNFTAAELGTSTHALTTHVPASSVTQTAYSCRVSFFSNHSHEDVAKNQPGFVEGRCYLPFPSVTDSDGVTGSDLSAQATDVSPVTAPKNIAASDNGNSCVICLVLILILLLLLIGGGIFAYCLLRRCQNSCSCPHSTEEGCSLKFRRCCGNIVNGHANACEADNVNQSLSVEVSQDQGDPRIATLPAEEARQLLTVPQRNGVEVTNVSTGV